MQLQTKAALAALALALFALARERAYRRGYDEGHRRACLANCGDIGPTH